MEKKLKLINEYLYRTLIKMFMPSVSKEFLYLLEDLRESEQSFGRKIDQAYDALQDTSRLVGKLETELTTKLERVNALKDEYERYSTLANIEEKKARALVAQLDATLNKGKVSERWMAFAINLVAGILVFILGVVLGPWVQGVLGIGT